MKLISLHIENFGCLQGFDLKFRDGLTVIHEANGFGKTTLAEFIRAMFYGFPRVAKTLDKNKRKKYLPWNGGKCGGHLTFEHEEGIYRIERTFGATPKGDSFNLIDLATNRKSRRFTENVGIELFQLDGESFERSTYMPQFHELGSLSTDSIQAKLGDLVEDTNDINNFDKAVKALKEKRSDYLPYRGGGGSVAEARNRISQLQVELDALERKADMFHSVRDEIVALEQEQQKMNADLATVREQLIRGSQAAADASIRRQYEELLAGYEACAAAEKRSPFSQRHLSQEDIDEARKDCEAYAAAVVQLKNTGLSDSENAQLSQLERFFAAGIPDDRKLEDLASLYRQLLRLQTMAESQALTPEERRQKEALSRYFEGRCVNQQLLDEAAADLERIAWLRQENSRLAEEKAALPAPKRHAPVAWLIILGIVALAAGIAVMVAGRGIPGGIVLGLGVLALLVGGYLAVKQMISRELNSGRSVMQLQSRMDANEAEAVRLEKNVYNLTGQFEPGGRAAEIFARIRSYFGRYCVLLNREAELENSRIQTQRERKACEEALLQELAPYFGATREYERAILQLQMRRSRLADLRGKFDATQTGVADLHRRCEALRERLCSFLSSYFAQVEPQRFHDLMLQLQRQYDDYCGIRTHRGMLESQIAVFYETHRDVLQGRTDEPAVDLDLLKQRERGITAGISDVTRQILGRRQLADQLRRDLDRVPQLRDALEQWQVRKRTDTKNAETLDETLAYLQQAKEHLAGNYLGTIRRSFTGLLGRMMGEETDKILLTGDLEVQLERHGQSRELAFFSAGQTDMVMLCMRFALVDALFPKVKPFVILDDPFVNLDDRCTAQALNLMKELARDRQIIYLTCNRSRI